jgi:hypothetical protein
MSFFDKFLHIPEKESHNQGGNVAAVNIGIGHNHHFMVPKFFQVKRF